MTLKPFLALLLFILAFSFDAFSQHLKLEDIPQLKVEDFKGAPPADTKYWAYTGMKIPYRLDSIVKTGDGMVKLKFITKVDVNHAENYFDLERIPKRQVGKILNHEQGHVTIGFIVANQLETLLSSKTWTENFRDEVRKEYLKYVAKYSELHQRYDEATSHGMNDEMQNKWDQQLKAMMQNSF
ncbi:DUF922 domain-containing protein [Pedobacter deserti]|uniref:DUF922 domain-containing protein n=1 Tax=Pedobacter deserti TaxID=2817382 RepID=UPI00210D5EB2|nr:DUF922 domain-containing protein [Pedobacter sp. SYSU D00382]